MPDPRRGHADKHAGRPARRERWSDYLILLKTPPYVLNTLGMTAMTFAIGGLAFWVPALSANVRQVDRSAAFTPRPPSAA